LSKTHRKQTRKTRSDIGMETIQRENSFEFMRKVAPILAKNPRQEAYLTALKTSEQIVVMGPAGTGKTFLAATHAADLLRQKRIEKIILTRPNVPGGRSIGFFPGTLEEKFSPWTAQIIADIKSRMGAAAFDIALKNGDIEMVPFEVMRGRSWSNAFILLDEAQNTTIDEMKMFLTRQGEDSTVVINGDISQSDLREASGLAQVIHLIKKELLPIPVIEFELDDIVRSGICATWVRVFQKNHL
jgi:phosphate starvation-inducible PhoH-like protein